MTLLQLGELHLVLFELLHHGSQLVAALIYVLPQLTGHLLELIERLLLQLVHLVVLSTVEVHHRHHTRETHHSVLLLVSPHGLVDLDLLFVQRLQSLLQDLVLGAHLLELALHLLLLVALGPVLFLVLRDLCLGSIARSTVLFLGSAATYKFPHTVLKLGLELVLLGLRLLHLFLRLLSLVGDAGHLFLLQTDHLIFLIVSVLL